MVGPSPTETTVAGRTQRMRILVTNDDGIRAEGLRRLVAAARTIGTVKVSAPDHERSACSHAMTMRDPLRVRPFDWGDPDIEAYEVNGYPSDCVNAGLTVAWPNGCDLVLAGINNGPNLGFDATYSGTVGGAMEGTINGIRSIAVSVACFVDDAPLHYETAERWLRENLEALVALPGKPLTLLNVNIPSIAYEEIAGTKVAGMGQRVYEDRMELRSDPWGRPYYWQGGIAVMSADQPGTDVEAVSRGFVAITPISLDWTDREYAEVIRHELSRTRSGV